MSKQETPHLLCAECPECEGGLAEVFADCEGVQCAKCKHKFYWRDAELVKLYLTGLIGE